MLARLSAEPLRRMRKLRGKVSALCESGVPPSSGTASGVLCPKGVDPWVLRRLCTDPSASPPERLDALHAKDTLLAVATPCDVSSGIARGILYPDGLAHQVLHCLCFPTHPSASPPERECLQTIDSLSGITEVKAPWGILSTSVLPPGRYAASALVQTLTTVLL